MRDEGKPFAAENIGLHFIPHNLAFIFLTMDVRMAVS
jgi:hypothetical protein